VPEDRKIKLVLKNPDCSRIGEITPFASFDAVSRVNDVGEARLVASYGASTRSDAVLDALGTPDVILEAFIQPPGHDAFLDEPAWSGFLRDRLVTQDGPTKTVTATFKDYNHLLARRVVKPPEGASHDEGYGCTPDVMRDLVRRQCAELCEDPDRVFPGLSVEANDCTTGEGLYADTSDMVFGANAPEWVRVNAIYSWGLHLYIGTETIASEGSYAAIYRSADGDTWDLVMDGTPGLYDYPITGVHCFAEFNGWLYAGCSQNWFADGALIMRSSDGVTWSFAGLFPNLAGIWAMCEFDGMLYAGTTGYTILDSETYLWRSADGIAWAMAAETTETELWCRCTCGASCIVGHGHEYIVACEALYEWDGNLYVGTMQHYVDFCSTFICSSRENYLGRVYRTADGTTLNAVLSSSSVHGFLSFFEFGDHLYTGSGRTRWVRFLCCTSNIDYASGGKIYRTQDGASWTQVFGGNLNDAHRSGAITQMIEGVGSLGQPILLASSGWRTGGSARIYWSEDGETWSAAAYFTQISYAFTLGLAYFGGEYYAAMGCYAKSGQWQADHGDVWRFVPSEADVAESGMVGRWTSLLDKLKEIAEQSGRYDFGIVGLDSFLYCGETQAFEFQVRDGQWGVDNRWDGTRGVTFAISRNNMARPEYAEVRGERPTMLYLLGPSADEERTIEEYEDAAEVALSPWGRIEGTVDAQGIDGATARASIGWAELELQGPYKTFDFEVLETDNLHYRGVRSRDSNVGWGLGDVITAVLE